MYLYIPNSTNFIFKNNSGNPGTPSATAYPDLPSGWSDSPPSAEANKQLWSSKGVAVLSGSYPNLSFNYTWEAPVIHVQNKADISLASVEDKSSSDIRDEIDEDESNINDEEELLELGEELEDELDEIIKPIGNATTENIGYIQTMEGFDIRLPKESIEQITRTIEMTPHEGFKPVVRVNMLGQIVLDFEPL